MYIRVISFASVVLVLTGSAFGLSIQGVVGSVSQSQYQTYQQAIEDSGLGLYDSQYDQGYRNRDGWAGDGSLGNQEARAYLTDQFTNMGLNVTIQGQYKNVVAELTGTTNPGQIYIIGGHYDTYLDGERPGGDDNASGTAGVLEAARVLSQYSFDSTIRFIGFNAEEDVMLGSGDYVDNVAVANSQNIAGMIDLDMILRPEFDNNLDELADLDVGTADTELFMNWANTFVSTAQLYVPSLVIDSGQPYIDASLASDHRPFINAGYPAFLLIENKANEIWGGSNAYYHTAEDASDALANDPFNPTGITYDYGFAADVVRATVATIALEAGVIPEPATLLIVGFGAVILRAKRQMH